MYTVYNAGRLMFDPRFDEYSLEAPTMTLEANKFGTLTFTIYPNHPEYDRLSKITSVLSVYKDGTLYKQFRPTWSRRAFKGGVQHKCESILARLNDFQYRPFDYTGTLEGFVEDVLDSYNARVESEPSKQILKGRILVTDPNNYVHYSSIDYLGHWDVLKTRLLDTHGGYFMERYSGGNVYLDYLRDEDLPTSTQAIEFGENLLDLFIDTDSDETFSVLVPVGADVQTFDVHGDPVTKRLTVETVNDGKDYIENAAGIAIYGRRETTYRWQDVTIPQNLLTKGTEYLESIAVKFKETVELSAIDLHNANAEISSYNWMDWVPVHSTRHDLSEEYILQKLSVPLGNPSGSKITLGATQRTLTDRIMTEVSPVVQTVVQDIRDTTQLDFEELKQTITEQEQTLRAVIGTTETSILMQVVENYVGKSEYAEYQAQVGTEFSQTRDSITATATSVERYVDTSTASVKQYVNGVQTYMRYSTNGLELGAVGSDFMTRITNERISFLQDNQEVAYISNRKLYVTEAQITQRLLFGSGETELFAWVSVENGLGLKWTGQAPVSQNGGE